jgi:hypothetical protein
LSAAIKQKQKVFKMLKIRQSAEQIWQQYGNLKKLARLGKNLDIVRETKDC